MTNSETIAEFGSHIQLLSFNFTPPPIVKTISVSGLIGLIGGAIALAHPTKHMEKNFCKFWRLMHKF